MFAQTLSLSGNALAPWAVLSPEEATRRAIKLGRVMGCVSSSRADHEIKAPEVVRCLRTKAAEDIVNKCEKVLDWYTDISYPFVPSVENFDGHNRPFMITPPLKVLRDQMPGLTAKTWVTGVTTHDGLPQALQLMVFKGMLSDLNEHFEDRVWDFLGLNHIGSEQQRRQAGRRLRDFYLPGNETISQGTLSGLIDLASDALYYHSMHEAVLLHSEAKKAPILVYRFGFDRHKNRQHILGVPLGTDSELLFPTVFAMKKSTLTEEEVGVSKKMLRLITNYVAVNDPTPEKELLLDNIEWPPAAGANFSFLEVGLNGHFSVNQEGFHMERMALWGSILQEFQDETFSHDNQLNEKGNQIKDEL